MAAAPRLTNPSAPAWPVGLGPGRPAAAIRRLSCLRALTPVAPDPCEGRAFAAWSARSREIAASWALVLGLAILGFVLF